MSSYVAVVALAMLVVVAVSESPGQAAPARGVQVVVEVDRPTGVYRVGEPATFRIAVKDPNGQAIQSGTLTVTLGVQGGAELAKKELALSAEPATVSGTLEQPGFLRCVVRFMGEADEARGLTMAAFEPARIQPVTTMPADFDAFWQAAVTEADAIPLDMRVEHLPAYSDGQQDSYKISFANIEDTRLEGYLCVPKGKGPFPAYVEIPYSGLGLPEDPSPAWARRGALSLVMEVHPLTLEPHKPREAYRQELDKRYPDYWRHGLPDHNKYYFRRAVVGVSRAIIWLASRADFDGKHLVIYGSSQGGWFAFMMASLNSHVTAMAANAPAGCDQPFFLSFIGPRGDRATPEELARHKAAYAYYDAVNFARRSRAGVPALVSAGFRDATCPPPGIYAAFNAWPGPKRFENMVQTGHGITNAYVRLLDTWIAEQLGLPAPATTKPATKPEL